MVLANWREMIKKAVERRDDLLLSSIVQEIGEAIEQGLKDQVDCEDLAGAAEALVDEIDRAFNPQIQGGWADVGGR